MKLFKISLSFMGDKSDFITAYVQSDSLQEAIKKTEEKLSKIGKIFSVDELDSDTHFIIP